MEDELKWDSMKLYGGHRLGDGQDFTVVTACAMGRTLQRSPPVPWEGLYGGHHLYDGKDFMEVTACAMGRVF